MFDPSMPKGRVISAALQLAAHRRWSEVSMLDIADAAGIGMAELRREFPSKSAILSGFTRTIDDVVLSKSTKPQTDTPARDAIFEVLMNRFDAMGPYKSGLKSIVADIGFDTEFAKRLFASQAWMLNAAGVPLDGLGGSIRVFGLTSVYTAAFRTWLEDDDPGLARTMAALDRRLRRGEQSLQTLDGVCATVSRVISAFTTARPLRPAQPSAAAEADAGGRQV
jgi:ubiquinone biosynthesis protein COQ9